MNTVRKINEDLSIAGQLTSEQLQQLFAQGYRSVVNLRSPEEKGFLGSEKQDSEYAGLQYLHLPIKVNLLDSELALQTVQQIAQLPKPILLHCDSGIRSAIIALIQVAMKQGIGVTDAFQKVVELGLLEDQSI